jgi:hypothetical protein
MTTTTMTQDTRGTTGAGKLFGQAVLGGAIAAVANLALYFGAQAAGVSLQGEFQPGQLGALPVPAVVMASLVPALFAAVVALLARRFTQNGARTFAIISVVFTLVSLGGPLGVVGASVATKVVMDLMHVVAAAGIGGMLYRALR